MEANIRLNKAYRKAYESKQRYRVLYGGAGSGKSHYVMQETLIRMMSDPEYRFLVVRKTARSLRNSVFHLLSSLVSEYGLSNHFVINKTEMTLTCLNGATLITSGLDDVEKLKSVSGINRIIIEEASEITEKDFQQLDLRLRGKNRLGYQITLMFNPVSELSWLKKRFFDLGGEDVFIHKTTFPDNGFLDPEYRAKLADLVNQDYQYYRIYALGEWGSIGNLVYTNWEKADLNALVDVGDRQMRLRDTFDNFFHGIDWGFSIDPFAYVKLHVDLKRKILYITDEVYRVEMHNDEIVEAIKPLVGNDPVTCDNEAKSIADLRRRGINAKASKKGAGSIEYGIKFIQGFKIIVDIGCPNTIKELSGYKWREDKDGNIIPKPVDMNNHSLDAIRYALEDINKNAGFGWK